MKSNETFPSDPYAFDPSEVVKDDMNVLEFQIPFSAEGKKKMGRLAVADEIEVGPEA